MFQLREISNIRVVAHLFIKLRQSGQIDAIWQRKQRPNIHELKMFHSRVPSHQGTLDISYVNTGELNIHQQVNEGQKQINFTVTFVAGVPLWLKQ